MSRDPLLEDVRTLGGTRAEVVAAICSSPLAPEGETLTPSAFGMWFTRGNVAHKWRPAVLERLGRIKATDEAAA